MNKVLVIARREYTEVLRTKVFWVSALLPIAFVAGGIVLGARHNAFGDEAGGRMPASMGAFMYVLVMFMSIMPTSGMLLTSLIEEKSSRVIEVLLSAASPFELMAGKILGLVCVGLTNAALFIAVLIVAAGSTGALKPPSPALVVLFLVYYLPGFVMYASIYAGVGAAFNTMKDAQVVMMPLSFLLMLPFFMAPALAEHPMAGYTVVLSVFPLTSPTTMILRIAVLPSPPWWDVAGSLLLLGGSVPLIVWAAAKVFRTGVLLYGKPPKLGEILRWVRNT
jgi:ABC-2 type transport system permease protein